MIRPSATPIPHPRFRLPVFGDVFMIDFASPVLRTTDKLRKSSDGILRPAPDARRWPIHRSQR